MVSEITEEWEEDSGCVPDNDAPAEKIRQIIKFQKSLHPSSFRESSSVSRDASSSVSGRRSRIGSMSLRRWFEAENSSLITRSGSDSDMVKDPEDPNWWPSTTERGLDREATRGGRMVRDFRRRNLFGMFFRKKLITSLPKFAKWRRRRIKFGLKLKRLRILICGMKRR